MLMYVFLQAPAPTSNAFASPTAVESSENVPPQERSVSKTVGTDSRSNNRFSMAFGRFGSGQPGRPSSRPSSIALSPNEGPHVLISPSSEKTPTPLALSGDAGVIAPCGEQKRSELDKDLENERLRGSDSYPVRHTEDQ